ncbi:MAG TPA: YfhO family protein, partial [Pseudolabrys sp.]|nr:YfhO family protein [Pseudolabrys sp.]
KINPGTIRSDSGAAYTAELQPRDPVPVVAISDGLNDPYRSSLRLFENSVELGPPHTVHDRLRERGGGTFSFWAGTLYFSTSDNTDPRVNGRDYAAEIPLGLGSTGWLAFLALNFTVITYKRRDVVRIIRRVLLALRPIARACLRAEFAWPQELAAVVLMAGLPILLPYVVGYGGALFEDVVYSTLPVKQLAVRALAAGELPLWASALGAGLPLVGDGTTLPYDPRNTWWGMLRPLDAYVAMLLTSRCIFAVVCYLYFRLRIGLSRGPAFVATCVYFCGTLFVMEARFSHLASGLEALPMLAWSAERLLDRPGLQRALQFSLGWFVLLLIASPAYFIFHPFLIGAWVLLIGYYTPGIDRVRRLSLFTAWYSAGLAWGLALFALAFLPFVEMVGLSNRGAEYLNDAFAWRSLWGLVVGPVNGTLGMMNMPFSYFLYVGVIALPLVLATLVDRDTPRLKAIPWLAALTLSGIFILSTPMKAAIAKWLPIVNTVSFFRVSFFWGFLAAVLVGYALERPRWKLAPWLRPGIVALVVIQFLVAGFVVVFVIRAWLTAIELPEWQNLVRETKTFVLPYGLASAILLYAAIRTAGLLLCLKPGGALHRFLIGGLLAAEVFVFFSFFNLWPSQPFPVTTEVAYLRERASPNYRSLEVMDFDNRKPVLEASSSGAINSLHQNAQAWWPGLLSANAYNSLVPATYWSFIVTIGDRPAPWRAPSSSILPEKADSPLLPLLGVRWLISRHELDPGPYHMVYEGNAYYIYERDDVMPRAFVVSKAIEIPDPTVRQLFAQVGAGSAPAELVRRAVFLSQPAASDRDSPSLAHDIVRQWLTAPEAPPFVPASVVSDSGNRVVAKVCTAQPGWFVLTDNYYPGWAATVNGSLVEIRRANLFARSVPIAAGCSEVVFQYVPVSFWRGAVISAAAGVVTALAILTLLALSWIRRRRSRPSVVKESLAESYSLPSSACGN